MVELKPRILSRIKTLSHLGMSSRDIADRLSKQVPGITIKQVEKVISELTKELDPVKDFLATTTNDERLSAMQLATEEIYFKELASYQKLLNDTSTPLSDTFLKSKERQMRLLTEALKMHTELSGVIYQVALEKSIKTLHNAGFEITGNGINLPLAIEAIPEKPNKPAEE